MRVVKASTSLGKRLVATGQNWEGTFLYQLYDKWSTAKQEACNKCYDEYCSADGQSYYQFALIIPFGLLAHGYTRWYEIGNT